MSEMGGSDYCTSERPGEVTVLNVERVCRLQRSNLFWILLFPVADALPLHVCTASHSEKRTGAVAVTALSNHLPISTALLDALALL